MQLSPKQAAFFLFLACAASNAHAHVPHDIIYSLDVSPNFHEDGLVFASSTQFGEAHLVSTNHGETFSESHCGMDRTLVTGHTFSPAFNRDGVVYMVTREGYYKSTDRGGNWVKQDRFDKQEVLAIATAPDYTESRDLYILTKQGLHLATNDGAELETLRKHDEITFGKIEVLDGTLFVHGVYYEKQKMIKGMEHIDYASGRVDAYDLETRQWSPLAERFASSIISDFDISRTGDAYAIAVALKDGTVFRSDNSGDSWKEIFRRNNDYICKIKFSPHYQDDHTIAAGTAKGFMFLSDSQGETWDLKSNGLSRWVHHTDILVTRLLFSPNYKNDKTLLLGKTTGFYKTTDNGDFWRHINVWNTKWGYYVHPAPGKGSKDVFTATYNSGISRSRDHGDTWESANIGITSAFANGMQLSPNYSEDKTIFVVDIATGLYRSRDSGKSWSKIQELDISKFYDQPVLHRELGVSHDFANDGVILLFTVPRRILGVREKHVWKYNDKTKEVKRVVVGNTANYINAFAFPPVGSKENLMFCASGQGVFRSEDKGHTWAHVLKGVPASQVFVSPNLDNDGLVIVMDGDGRLFSSTNWGESFGPSDLNLDQHYVNNLVFSPNYASDNTLYATTFGEGVLRSQDNGRSWSYFGLKGKFLYTGLNFSANYTEDGTIFAPAIDGIYRSTDCGENWNNVLDVTQFLPKEPFLTLKDPQGKAIPIKFGEVALMKQYDAWDAEVGPEIYRKVRNGVQKVSSPNAYLATYYKFRVDSGYAFEVYFYGTSIEYKCVQGKDLGIVEILLDGKSQGRFDLYHATERCDVTGFLKDDLKIGFHTLRIEATGEKNPKSRSTAISFNAANIRN